MKNSQNNFIEGIGNTPLIKLKAASKITGCNIYGKAEYLNPGGSVKDRAAFALIKDAQEKKLISKCGIVVEGTAGNTGIGLCLLGNSLGYKTIIVMNDNQTQEKKDTLINIGADLRLVPPKPYKDDGNYVKVAGRLADELKSSNNNGVVWANQFDNTANAKGHYETTGPEIWNQTEGKVDGFVCSSGTGGTIGGVSSYLKEKNKNIKIHEKEEIKKIKQSRRRGRKTLCKSDKPKTRQTTQKYGVTKSTKFPSQNKTYKNGVSKSTKFPSQNKTYKNGVTKPTKFHSQNERKIN